MGYNQYILEYSVNATFNILEGISVIVQSCDSLIWRVVEEGYFFYPKMIIQQMSGLVWLCNVHWYHFFRVRGENKGLIIAIHIFKESI